jgi:hypothetical protein
MTANERQNGSRPSTVHQIDLPSHCRIHSALLQEESYRMDVRTLSDGKTRIPKWRTKGHNQTMSRTTVTHREMTASRQTSISTTLPTLAGWLQKTSAAHCLRNANQITSVEKRGAPSQLFAMAMSCVATLMRVHFTCRILESMVFTCYARSSNPSTTLSAISDDSTGSQCTARRVSEYLFVT